MKTRRQQVVEFIARERISAIIRTQDKVLAADAMAAAVDGGFRAVEFTLTTPGALDLISDFSHRQGLCVGAGTVLTSIEARDAVAAGAQFLVSPVFDSKVVAEAGRFDVACLPGAFTPTEFEMAHRGGADFVKVFPAPPGGLDFVRAVLAPLPHLRLFPTAGVTVDNLADYLEAGCAGAGFVRSLFEPDFLRAADFKSIRNRAKDIVGRRDAYLGH